MGTRIVGARRTWAFVLRRDEDAASEIVGVLMLITIVVAASASFATFALDKQDEVQEQKRFEHLKASEAFLFTDIDLVDAASDGDWDEITVTIQPLHDRTVTVTGAELSGDALREFTVERHMQPSPNKYRLVAHDDPLPYTFGGDFADPVAEGLSTGPLERLTIPGREAFKITINLKDTGANPQGGGASEAYDPADDTEDFFPSAAPVVTDSDAFRVSFTTGYLNRPEQAFTPPDIVVVPRLDCAYDLLAFELRDVHVRQDQDYALKIDWSAITTGAGGPFAGGTGSQYLVSIAAPAADGDTITATVAVEMASGLRSSKSVPLTLPAGCV